MSTVQPKNLRLHADVKNSRRQAVRDWKRNSKEKSITLDTNVVILVYYRYLDRFTKPGSQCAAQLGQTSYQHMHRGRSESSLLISWFRWTKLALLHQHWYNLSHPASFSPVKTTQGWLHKDECFRSSFEIVQHSPSGLVGNGGIGGKQRCEKSNVLSAPI